MVMLEDMILSLVNHQCRLCNCITLTQGAFGHRIYFYWLRLRYCRTAEYLESIMLKKTTLLMTKGLLAISVAAGLTACSGSNSLANSTTTTTEPSTPSTDATGSGNASTFGITSVPSALSSTYTTALKFNRYTKVDTPNGGAIHIIAQDQITQDQIIRARSILQHYLTDYPGSAFGADKSAVANKMADNGATLLLLNGVDDGTNQGAQLDGQPLYYGEMQVEGGSWYLAQNYQHRDASYEEILHLVHDSGIGVDQNANFVGALPEFQTQIRAAQTTAVSDKLWAWSADFSSWLTELTAENSLSQEYLAAVIDSYYGLWGAHSGKFGMWGGYIAKTRADITAKDPAGAALMNKQFFHPYLTYNARIAASFNGDFSLKFDPALAYTHHSQYLKDITLTGNNASNVIVNQLNNHITGNKADNAVRFSGNSSEYQISKGKDAVVVSDMQDNRDGKNTLVAIERLVFTNATLLTAEL